MKERFDIDPAHSTIGFTAKHMMVSTVRGRFGDFEGHIEVEDGEPATAVAEFTIDVASIDTDSEQRDSHLRSADFFDSERHPKLSYRSTSVRPLGDGRFAATGDLAIRGESHPVELEVEVGERFPDPWGNERVAISASGAINRKQWGLNWNQVLEAGRLLVSETVKLEIDAALVRKIAVQPVVAEAERRSA